MKTLSLSCSCPDIASMCKHVAAALYGVSARLDQKPELFFLLRGIEMNDFLGTMVRQESEKMVARSKTRSRRTIDAKTDELSQLFGITMEEKVSANDIMMFDVQKGSYEASKKKPALRKDDRQKKKKKSDTAVVKAKKKVSALKNKKTKKTSANMRTLKRKS
ncbi:MAG: hypothetical protein JW795_05920 [Chitinivibrionales bacterium]|nr:hypothetical protein [Chitinivibrionales bacterium]